MAKKRPQFQKEAQAKIRTAEVSDIRIQNPVHLPPGYTHPDRIQRIVYTADRAKAITKTKKHLLLNLY